MRSLGRSAGRFGIKRRAWASGKKEKAREKKRTTTKNRPPPPRKFALETNVIWDTKGMCCVRYGPRSGTVSSRKRRKQTPSHRVPVWFLRRKGEKDAACVEVETP